MRANANEREERREVKRKLCRERARVVAVMLIAAVTFPVAAQERSSQDHSHVPDASDILRNCEPGRRIEFRFGSTSLYIDPRWVEYGTLMDVFQKYGPACPSGPVVDVSIYFKSDVLRLIDAPKDLGSPYFFLLVGTPRDKDRSADLHPSRHVRPRDTAEPWVEDVTNFGGKVANAWARVYDLHYPDDKDFVEISCGGRSGDPGGRECFTVLQYLYRKDLGIRYIFRQDHFAFLTDQSAAQPEDSEPRVVLAFDARLRRWLDSVMHPPGGGEMTDKCELSQTQNWSSASPTRSVSRTLRNPVYLRTCPRIEDKDGSLNGNNKSSRGA
jgi:hypothetical protein